MAFPFLSDETWDDGTRGNFDSETDLSSILDFPNYAVLAASGFAPFKGSHSLRLALNGTATANIAETGGFDTALGGTISIWFPVCIAADLTLTAGDAVILFALQDGAPGANQAVFGVRNNGGTYELFAGQTGATNTLAITRSNKTWHQIELTCTIDSGGANNGTIDFYVNGGAVGSQITGLDQNAIAQAQLGAISGTAAGNAGTILIGGIIADDLRIYPKTRFPDDTIWVTRDINAIVGPCVIDAAWVTGTGTDAVLTILDTDIYSSTGIGFSREPTAYFRNVTANDQSNPGFTSITVHNGAYIQLTGTNPQAFISISPECNGIVKSSANYIDRGLRRKGLI